MGAGQRPSRCLVLAVLDPATPLHVEVKEKLPWVGFSGDGIWYRSCCRVNKLLHSIIEIKEGGWKYFHEVPFFVRVKIPFFIAAHNPQMPSNIPCQTVQHTQGFSGYPSIRDATQQLTQITKKKPPGSRKPILPPGISSPPSFSRTRGKPPRWGGGGAPSQGTQAVLPQLPLAACV